MLIGGGCLCITRFGWTRTPTGANDHRYKRGVLCVGRYGKCRIRCYRPGLDHWFLIHPPNQRFNFKLDFGNKYQINSAPAPAPVCSDHFRQDFDFDFDFGDGDEDLIDDSPAQQQTDDKWIKLKERLVKSCVISCANKVPDAAMNKEARFGCECGRTSVTRSVPCYYVTGK